MRIALALAAILAGPSMAQEVGPSPATGQAVYSVFCQSCHGAGGTGDGDFADLLSVRPADLTRIAARAGGSFPEEQVMRHIDGRDDVRGHGVIMPVFGPLFDLEVALGNTETGEAVLTETSVADLTVWIETIQVSE
ncbi:c-type cytochrome [Roseivivax sediminis]|uniref:Cytochrome C oxidase, cbb3-type, subunit III n=1 Tax=Roseivivax sediminis TaxID=936889 RepID=A0A1I1X5Y5_9RHOB|nr:cytochrome c [Roseivivax sediminis]SFE02826.1 Cytochrome C oxidase, cbb3-type, subunit III [Roseivivax sediminis]